MDTKTLKMYLWGTAVIIVGILLLFRAFDVLTFDIFFEGWWTLFLLVPCGINMLTEKEKTPSTIGFVVGLFLLLRCQHVFDFVLSARVLVPVGIIALGVLIIYRAYRLDQMNKNEKDDGFDEYEEVK